MSNSSTQFLEDAGGELAAAAQTYRRHRGRRQFVVRAAFVLGVVSVVGVALSQRGAQAGPVQISVHNGSVNIEVRDPATAPATIETLLADAKIETTIEEVATGPSRVGRLVGLRGVSSTGTGALSLRVPIGSRVLVVVGRRAAAGEPYAAATDPFATSEPLACLGGAGADAAVVAVHLPANVTVRWLQTRSSKLLDISALRGNRVDAAAALSPTDVIVYVSPGPGVVRINWCQ